LSVSNAELHPTILAALVAVFQLAKDWSAHQTHWRRGSVIALIVLLTIGSTVNVYYTNKRTVAQRAKDHDEITGLKTAVETANQSQQSNTKQFVDAFGKLSQEVSDLQTQVKTEALQKKLTSVQKELQNTQKALAPGPKAELSLSFAPFPNTPFGQPIVLVTDKNLPLNADGSVHVDFDIVNTTNVDAVEVEINFQICNQCKYFKEPDGLGKLPGLGETQRYLYMHDLLAKMAYKTLGVDVIPPPSAQSFFVGIEYRCHTCIITHKPHGGSVHISQL
jgi:hypothetical protein